MRRTDWLVVLAACSSACTSASTAGDLRRVRTLAHAPVIAKVSEQHVEPTTDGDARTLLREPLSPERAVRVALLNNRALRAELRELGISRGHLMQAGLVGNPGFEVELLPERDSNVALRVEYDLRSLLLAPLAARAASAELTAQQYRVAGSVVELGYEVRTAWIELAAEQQRLAFAVRTLDALTAGRDAAVALLDAGSIPPLEASRQIVAYEGARIEVAKHELALVDRREHMQRLLGLYGEETEWQLAGGLAELPGSLALPDKLETTALTASLELKELEQRLEAAARRTGYTRAAGWVPSLAVDVHALHTDPGAYRMEDRRWRYGGGVSVGVPLFDRQQGELRATEAEFDGLLERQQGLAIDLRSHARAARNRLRSTHARALAYQQTLVPAQRTVVEQSVLQYNAMQLNLFELLLARRAELEIELSSVDALAAYWTAQAELDALLAGKQVDHRDEADEHGSMQTSERSH